jgi:hypothetical protein
MNFQGPAKRLDDIDLPKIGAQIGVGEDELHAVIDVESRGTGFDKKNRPIILFERHWFYRLLPKHKRDQAMKAGLASTRWSRATYGMDQYDLLRRAMKIDEQAALKSCSWGLFQIMGFNHEAAGYPSVQSMVIDFTIDEENHLQAAVNFIVKNGLDDELRRHDWAGFAEAYNGPGYRKNRYDEKLVEAYLKWSRIRDTPYNPELVEVVKDAAASGRLSTTNVAAGMAGIGGAASVAGQVADTVNETRNAADSIMAAGPWILLAIVCIGAAVWIYRERRRKSSRARRALT